jgi:hypothetical protein
MHTLRFSSLCIAVFCFLLAAPAHAQEERGQGYVFAGLGAVDTETSVLHVGVGGEANIYKGLGFGAEIGGAAALRSIGGGVGLLSLNGQYTFLRRTSGRVRPFITGGYTMIFEDGSVNAFNLGGGMHYWFARHLGLRLEFRDHVFPGGSRSHLWQGRVGLEFR